MKLWILRSKRQWNPWYDKATAFVVRADSEEAARELAAQDCGDEGPAVWRDSEKTSCEPLLNRGKAEVVIRDYNAA